MNVRVAVPELGQRGELAVSLSPRLPVDVPHLRCQQVDAPRDRATLLPCMRPSAGRGRLLVGGGETGQRDG